MIRLEKFAYCYPAQKHFALRDITVQIPDGQFVGVVGANGAGKSTLCYALSGFAPHFFQGRTRGKLSLNDMDVSQATLGDLAGEVGLVFQNPFNQISGARFTVREELAFGLENLGLPRKQMVSRVDQVLDELDLDSLAERSPFELSGGQQQRLAIASILAMRPRVLVLDEPTSQLDPHSTQAVFKNLERITRQGDTTVILVEHKPEWMATFADRVLVLDAGRVILDGKPQDILADVRLSKLGVVRSRYSQASQAARKRKLVPKSGPIPVTLQQAREFFR